MKADSKIYKLVVLNIRYKIIQPRPWYGFSTIVVSILEMCEFILHSTSNRLGDLFLSKGEIPRIIGYIKEEKYYLHMKYTLNGSSMYSQC